MAPSTQFNVESTLHTQPSQWHCTAVLQMATQYTIQCRKHTLHITLHMCRTFSIPCREECRKYCTKYTHDEGHCTSTVTSAQCVQYVHCDHKPRLKPLLSCVLKPQQGQQCVWMILCCILSYCVLKPQLCVWIYVETACKYRDPINIIKVYYHNVLRAVVFSYLKEAKTFLCFYIQSDQIWDNFNRQLSSNYVLFYNNYFRDYNPYNIDT